ncbi:hypothetical protein D3C72_2493440 [compost metagenome]
MAVEELDLVAVLEEAHLGGDGGLAYMEMLRRLGETAHAGHRVEGAKLCESHRKKE